MEETRLILFNGDKKCKGEITRSQGGVQSAIDFVFISQPMHDNFLEATIDETKDMLDLSDHCFLKTKFNFSNMNVQYRKGKSMYLITR